MSPAIQVKNLVKKFDEFTAVNDLSFDIPAGQIVGLLGGNGAGKTTTLSILMGILLPTTGQISILGIDMLKNRHSALEKMNFSSPYVDLPGEMTVRENLTVFSHLYNVPHYKDRIGELVTEFDLSQFINKAYGKLSAGQKTRVLLAKALINSP
jgi:ABC-2 type transport system ATP-binding protein